MAYKTLPGIEMIQVCGQNLLVASRSAWEKCPRVRPIPKSWAVCWSLMANDKTDEDAIKTFAALFHKPEEEVHSHFDRIYQKLAEEGYLIEADKALEDVHDAN